MRRIFVLFTFVVLVLGVHAQQDSIQVVIECDSLYKPFLKEIGTVEIREGHYSYDFKLDSKQTFNIPFPKDSSNSTLFLRFGVLTRYLTGAIYAYNDQGYRPILFDHGTGRPIQTDFIRFDKERSIQIHIPVDTFYDKYLIDNTCPECNLNDSISWITYGFLIEDPITGGLNLPELFNPYNNPILDNIYNPECTSRPQHWYCHRCKREY